MKVATIELTAWRNYASQKLVVASSPTILVGRNGQGKTNFVEAIVYAALGRSHRTHSDATLVKSGSEQAIVRMSVENAGRKLDIDLAVTASGSNTIRVNGNKTKRRDLARMLPLVIFAPEDMDLVRGDPENRRDFMDDVISEISAASAMYQDFDRVLKQRNSLLKSIRGSGSAAENSTLDTWTEAFITAAIAIIVARRTMIAELAPRITAHYSAIAGVSDIATVRLNETVGDAVPDEKIATTLREAFAAHRADEIERGSTLIGPHRDDLTLTLNELSARTHSSQGEAWSFALALRLAMVDIVRNHSLAGDPVVILDDVFSELDEGRRNRLGQHLVGIEHLIITAADEATIPESISGERHNIEGGRIDG